MSTLGTNNLTLGDLAKRLTPEGSVDRQVIELLDKEDEILSDAAWVECNDGSRHITTVRTGIPTPTWRRMYGGVASTKSSTAQVSDSCGMLQCLPIVDAKIVDMSKDPSGILLSEQAPHLEGMRQAVASTIFYGDTQTYPERFNGLDVRYNDVEGTDDTMSGFNVLDGGSTTDQVNTSIWLVTWGPNTAHMLYPSGSKAGISMDNKGKLLVDADDSSGKFDAYVTKYAWDCGLSVRDWRSVGRICDIDVSDLETDGTDAADIIKLMIRLSERVEGMGRRAWYMHPRVRTMLRIQMLGTSNVNLTYDTVEGKRVLAFDGIPIRACKSILLTEGLHS